MPGTRVRVAGRSWSGAAVPFPPARSRHPRWFAQGRKCQQCAPLNGTSPAALRKNPLRRAPGWNGSRRRRAALGNLLHSRPRGARRMRVPGNGDVVVVPGMHSPEKALRTCSAGQGAPKPFQSPPTLFDSLKTPFSPPQNPFSPLWSLLNPPKPFLSPPTLFDSPKTPFSPPQNHFCTLQPLLNPPKLFQSPPTPSVPPKNPFGFPQTLSVVPKTLPIPPEAAS